MRSAILACSTRTPFSGFNPIAFSSPSPTPSPHTCSPRFSGGADEKRKKYLMYMEGTLLQDIRDRNNESGRILNEASAGLRAACCFVLPACCWQVLCCMLCSNVSHGCQHPTHSSPCIPLHSSALCCINVCICTGTHPKEHKTSSMHVCVKLVIRSVFFTER